MKQRNNMKRIQMTTIGLMTALSSFAAGSGSSPDEGWITFLAVLYIVGAVLQIILFFKVWGMTNDVDSLKRRIVDNTRGADLQRQCRRLAVMGDKAQIRELMLDLFFEELEAEYEKSHYTTYNLQELKKRSLGAYKDRLRSNLSSIGEPVPEDIKNLQTFDDYLSLISIN